MKFVFNRSTIDARDCVHSLLLYSSRKSALQTIETFLSAISVYRDER